MNEQIKFLNEVVRPTAEKLRALKAEFASIATQWGYQQSLFANTATLIEDDRTDGATKVSGQDVHDIMYLVGVLSNALNAAASATIEKPCVRTFQVGN